MNNKGRDKIWNALLDANDLAIGVTPLPSRDPSHQHEVVEVFVRSSVGKDPTPVAISALAHVGLLHTSNVVSSALKGGDTPQLELIGEIEDSTLLHGDKKLFFVDKTVGVWLSPK